MPRVTPDAFVAELAKLFSAAQGDGKSVVVTAKRHAPAPAAPGAAPPAPPACLYRAIHGARKVSALVRADEAAKFHAAYVTVLKVCTTGMKRPKKTEKKKAAAAALAGGAGGEGAAAGAAAAGAAPGGAAR